MVHLTLLVSSAIAAIQKNKKLWLWCSFCILIIFAVLRYNFGNDYTAYLRIYNEIRAGGSSFAREPMLPFLVRLCPNYYIFIAITSVITIIPIYFLIKKYVIDSYKGLAVLIYCINPYLFLLSLSSIRQMLALSFFIIAIHFSKDHKIIPYLIFIALATTCHISAIILLPFYFIANENKMNKLQIIAVVVFLLIMLLGNELFDKWMQYALDYFSDINYNTYATQGGNTLRATLLSSIWFVYIVININRLSGSTLMFSKLSLVGYIFAILAYKVSMLGRITMYFEIFSIITIPMIMHQNNTSFISSNKVFWAINKYVFPMLIFTVYALRYYSFFTNPIWESFREYHTILSVI